MNALRGTFSVNEHQFKELIGHMNWKKFSDRIQEQLATNQNLTKEQKQLMEVNAIIALMRSHQFDKAQNAIKKAGLDCHPAITGLRVYFLMKDKKYEEALATISSQSSKFAVFIRVHIYQQMRESERAVDALLEDLETWAVEKIPSEYFLMLFKSMLSVK